MLRLSIVKSDAIAVAYGEPSSELNVHTSARCIINVAEFVELYTQYSHLNLLAKY